MHVVPFQPAHLQALVLQENQAWMRHLIDDPQYGNAMANGGPSFAAEEDGHILICAGLMHMWEGRSCAWALVSKDAGKRFVRIYRAIHAFFEMQTVTRIEATVDVNFEQGHRLVKMLGFTWEGRMRAYVDGRDCDLYARVRGGV